MSKREQRQQKLQERRRRQMMIAGGILAVIAVMAVAAVILTRKPDYGIEFDDQGNTHITEEPATYIWNSRPPTSGPHADGLASWGVHEDLSTAPDWRVVHNLEDGGVIINYNCPQGCPEMVDELKAIMDDIDHDHLLLRPYPEMEHTIAVTAWTRMLTLDAVDETQIKQFIERYIGIDHHVQGIG